MDRHGGGPGSKSHYGRSGSASGSPRMGALCFLLTFVHMAKQKLSDVGIGAIL